MQKKIKSHFSESLHKFKPLMKELLDNLLTRYEYISILSQESRGNVYRVSKSGISIADSVLLAGKGTVIKIYDKKLKKSNHYWSGFPH